MFELIRRLFSPSKPLTASELLEAVDIITQCRSVLKKHDMSPSECEGCLKKINLSGEFGMWSCYGGGLRISAKDEQYVIIGFFLDDFDDDFITEFVITDKDGRAIHREPFKS